MFFHRPLKMEYQIQGHWKYHCFTLCGLVIPYGDKDPGEHCLTAPSPYLKPILTFHWRCFVAWGLFHKKWSGTSSLTCIQGSCLKVWLPGANEFKQRAVLFPCISLYIHIGHYKAQNQRQSTDCHPDTQQLNLWPTGGWKPGWEMWWISMRNRDFQHTKCITLALTHWCLVTYICIK